MRLQMEKHANVQVQLQQRQEALVSSPQRTVTQQAVERLQTTEGYLDSQQIVALIDLVTKNASQAGVYLSLKREDVRKAWVSKRLSELKDSN